MPLAAGHASSTAAPYACGLIRTYSSGLSQPLATPFARYDCSSTASVAKIQHVPRDFCSESGVECSTPYLCGSGGAAHTGVGGSDVATRSSSTTVRGGRHVRPSVAMTATSPVTPATSIMRRKLRSEPVSYSMAR